MDKQELVVVTKHEIPGSDTIHCSSLLASYDPVTRILICRVCGSDRVVLATSQDMLNSSIMKDQPKPVPTFPKNV